MGHDPGNIAGVEAPGLKARVRALAWRHPLLWLGYNLRHIFKSSQMLFLDYRVEPSSRYGYGKPVHPRLHSLFQAGQESYRELLRSFAGSSEKLRNIPAQKRDETTPYWNNQWLPPLDAMALYCLLAQRKPRLYLEVGSGNSTKFARRAVSDHGLSTKIVSLDPSPRAEIDRLCDRVIRQRLQDADLSLFRELTAGDVLFLDNSHVLLTNSDVSVALLEVLPELPAGVLVQVHDVFLPYDYPPRWAHRYYAEQYALAFALLEGSTRLQVLLPNAFVSNELGLRPELQELAATLSLDGFSGTSLWLVSR